MVASLDSFGASRFPLIISENNAQRYDPGIAVLSGLLSTAIEAACGDAWRSIISGLDQTNFLTASTGPVGSVLNVIPTPQNLTQIKSTWPVLAIYREGEPSCGAYSVDYRNITQRWSIDWIVGPLGPDTQRKVGHFWVKVRDAILVALIEGMHPSYQSGAYVFHGIFSEIWPVTSAGPAVTDILTTEKGAGYFGGSVIAETVERMTFQNRANATELEFEGGAYLTPHDGYGDDASEALVDVDFENETADDIEPPAGD